MGRTASKGAGGIAALLQRIESSDAAIPPALLQALATLARQWRAADAEVAALDKQILALVRENPAAPRLMTIPGVGPLTAHAVVAAKIGRASCRERVCQYVSIPVVAAPLKKKQKLNQKNNIQSIK